MRQKNTYEGDGTDAPVGTILSWMYEDQEIITVKTDVQYLPWETVRLEDAYDLPYLMLMFPPESPIIIIRWPVGIQP
jgi:hypothetical protein